MMDPWGEDYVRLGLRIEKVFPGYVDGYYGPPTLKAQVDHEPAAAPRDLVRMAARLADALPAQGYAAERAAYLARQVRAMETQCRKLAGETFDLADEVERLFDIQVTRTPEAEFEAGVALYEAALPGPEPLTERVAQWRTRHELPQEKVELVGEMLRAALAETRQRTAQFVDLPEGEAFAIETVSNQPWTAYNWYLGGYQSRIELNTDLPTDLSRLLETMAHEGYPGHHTEHALKEQRLYRDQGRLEHSILLINTPECVISEGIATLAADMIFAPGEDDAWLDTHIYPQAGIAPDGVDMALIRRARELLADVQGNAAFLLHVDGRPDEEVVQYLIRYSLVGEARARKSLEFLKSPLWRAYTFTYTYGRRLMQPHLQGDDRLTVFRRFLTEAVYPSQLAAPEI